MSNYSVISVLYSSHTITGHPLVWVISIWIACEADWLIIVTRWPLIVWVVYSADAIFRFLWMNCLYHQAFLMIIIFHSNLSYVTTVEKFKAHIVQKCRTDLLISTFSLNVVIPYYPHTRVFLFFQTRFTIFSNLMTFAGAQYSCHLAIAKQKKNVFALNKRK